MAPGGSDGDDPLIAEVGRELQRNLTRDEEVRLNIHQHPMVLWRPVAYLIGALVLLGIVVAGDRLPMLVLLIVLAAAGHLGWKILVRRNNTFAATTRRVMRVDGLVNKSVPMMRLQKITDMRLDQPLIGRLFGYGTITIESAGQDQSIRELRYAPHPTQVFRRLNSVIFGEEYAGSDQLRPPAARRAVSSAARGARRAVGATRRQAQTASQRRRPANSSGPSSSISSPIGDRTNQTFFGAGDQPRSRGRAVNPPVTGTGPSEPQSRHTAGPRRDEASSRHTAAPRRDDDTDEIPTLRRPPT